MDAREELAALRRLAELEAKASGMTPDAFAKIKADGRNATPLPAGLDTAAQVGTPRNYDQELRNSTQLDQVPYELGAKVNDAAAKVLPAPFAAGLGAAANAGMEGLAMAAGGGIGGGAGQVVKGGAQGSGRWLMQKALKPSPKDMLLGKGDRAINTILEEGVNVSRGGADALRGTGTGLNKQVKGIIAGSDAKIPVSVVDDGLEFARQRFANSPDQVGDYAAIQSAGDKFLANNKLSNLGAEEARIQAEIAAKNAARIQALQDSGRYQTMAAQQENLAHGGGVNLRATRESTIGRPDIPVALQHPTIPSQPLNEPVMQVGTGGGRSLSPSAYPAQEGMIGQPRIPGRYTHNIDRVPEAQSAADEFARIAKIRAYEKEIAELELKAHLASGGSGIPIQTAQDLKQGLHQNLKDKYGTLTSPEEETQKALAYALRKGIEKEAPAVAPLNARASDIWNALNVMERRVAVGGNNNPIPLGAALSKLNNPAWGGGMILNGWDLGKSALARMLYTGGKYAPEAGGVTGAGLAALLRDEPQ